MLRNLVAASLLIASAVVPILVISPRSAADAAGSSNESGLVLCDGQEESLKFVLKPGGKIERDLWLENRSNETITIEKIGTSCDCVKVVTPLAELVVEPKKSVAIRLAIEITKNDAFRGEFGPLVELIGPAALRMSNLSLIVEVRQ